MYVHKCNYKGSIVFLILSFLTVTPKNVVVSQFNNILSAITLLLYLKCSIRNRLDVF